MDLSEITPVEAIALNLRATSKKNALQELAKRASDLVGVDAREMFEALLERENLGSTGVGGGVAIPHCRRPDIDKMYGMFARLEAPIEFDAVDSEPVDLIYVLIAPEGAGSDHLKALARVSRVMREASMRNKLRGAKDAAAAHALLGLSKQPSKAA